MARRYSGSMRARHLPRLWLMTDERQGDDLWVALARLPQGSGVVFRHYSLPPAERRALFARVKRIARKRGLIVVRAGPTPMRGEDGTHNRQERGRGLRTFAVHNARDAVHARRAGGDLVFVSPIFDTNSHPTARPLGAARLGLLMRALTMPAVALGGMNRPRFRHLTGLDLWGWAAIDAWRTTGHNRRQSAPTP